MLQVLKRFSTLRDHLFKLDDREPLNRLALVVIIALDIFILTVLFNGLADHTRQLTSPDEYVPYECRTIYVDNNWTEVARLDALQPLVVSGYENISYRYKGVLEGADTSIMHPTCSTLYRMIVTIADDAPLQELFVERKQLQNELAQLNSALERSRDSYNTSLLEDIAGQRGAEEQLTTIGTTSRSLSQQQEEIAKRLGEIDSRVNGHPLVATLWQAIGPDSSARATLLADYKHYQLTYALKKLLWQLLFLLPLFFIFYFWSVQSVRRQRSIQTLIASHLLVVSTIPILLKLIELVVDLIPHYFFQQLFELLEHLHLIALWHYLVIFATIAVALFLIYLIQKKVFNLHRTLQRRLMKGDCRGCGLRLPPASDYCPFCGDEQNHPCPACHASTPRSGDFCIHCGGKI